MGGGRLLWWKPSGVTQWWIPRLFRGTDEHCNPSLAVVLPPLGAFIVFYGRHLRREGSCPACTAEFGAAQALTGDDSGEKF